MDHIQQQQQKQHQQQQKTYTYLHFLDRLAAKSIWDDGFELSPTIAFADI